MFSRISEVGPNRKLVPSTSRLSFWTVWFRHNQQSAGQHSLTSVERPSYLRANFVNVWRHVRLEVYVIHLHFDRVYPTCLIFGERFCPTFSIIPRLIPINSRKKQEARSKKVPLPPFKGCFDVLSPRGNGPFSGCYWITSFEWPQITRLCI